MSTLFKPPDKKVLRKKYDEKCPLYKQLLEEVEYILSKGIKKRKIRISSIEHRIKAFESFYNKIVRKEITGDPFELIEDLAGARIICLYRSDLEKIEELIREKFDVIRAEVLREQARKPIGYMSDHYVVRLPQAFRGERYDAIKSFKCEIQVRTVSMHAWATVSHHLDYKQEADVPSDLRDDFLALSGVFHIADSLFEQFRKAREGATKTLMEKVKRDQFSLDEEINMDTLKAYLTWKFPTRTRDTGANTRAYHVSALLSELQEAKISSFRKLDEIVNTNLKWFTEFEKTRYEEGYFEDVGVIRIILKER